MRKLLVEIAAQPVELFRLAQFLGAGGLVELGGEGVIIRPARLVALVARPPRLGRGFRIAHLGVVGHFGGRRVDRFRGAVRQLVGRGLGLGAHLVAFGSIGCVAVLAGFVFLVLFLALFAFVLVGIA